MSPSPSSARCQSLPTERSLSASSRVAVVCGVVGCDLPYSTSLSLLPSRIVIVAVTPQSPPLPIPGIRQTQTPDTPVNVFIINAIIDVTLSPLCPLLVTGQVWHILVLPPHVIVVVVISTSSQGR